MWFFQYRGGCYPKQTATPIDLRHLAQSITPAGTIITVAGSSKDDLKSILLLVGKQPHEKSTIVLEDMATKHRYSAIVPSDSFANSFISFNLNGIGPRTDGYHLLLTSVAPDHKLRLYKFAKNSQPVIYAYYMGFPNYQ